MVSAGSPLRMLSGAGNPARSAVLAPGDGTLILPATPRRIVTGPRVGVSSAAEIPWRFWYDGDPTVSVYRAARAPATQTGYPLTACKWHHAGVDDIIDELSWRGLIAVSTDLDELRLALKSGRVTFYCGFDPTAPGLHIGNLVLLLTHAPPAARRAPPDRAGRRGDRADRRPERQVGRAGAQPR